MSGLSYRELVGYSLLSAGILMVVLGICLRRVVFRRPNDDVALVLHTGMSRYARARNDAELPRPWVEEPLICVGVLIAMTGLVIARCDHLDLSWAGD